MISEIAELLTPVWGPMRLLNSSFLLAAMGALVAAMSAMVLLPLLWKYLPTDQGRAHAVGSAASVGKPMSAGIIMIAIIIVCAIIFVPADVRIYGSLLLLAAASALGYIDDKSGGLSELTLGACDFLLACAAALLIFGFEPARAWLPFTAEIFEVPAWLHIPVAVVVIWFSINALNCSDGVDGLSGTLALISIAVLGLLFYIAVGNIEMARYLLLPFDGNGYKWAILSSIACGCLAGYLWYNVPPSSVMMGDAGSRPIGLLIGILVMVSGNPFLIIVCAGLILANGATGLFKVAMLRFFKLRLFSDIRFPLHDHVRKNYQWSNSQVLARFAMVHMAITLALVSMLLKVR
ncbi:hypothetical protein [Pseudohoeflea coraliihabitans]|uniref:Phospho-N-acetylmuramoyl-pentapeptide-transferase n=1 Tax=Pseudohoeflea coraliihabitans TaxID=2860393 RepID=A0ABS6WKC2_9HYPH|nr:hypothetical protein [Pseudohoeflea sp. DP4N28-3]MBW3096401.1 hypothetical protein [Pseudohoeflea sp. DP4N28-3]